MYFNVKSIKESNSKKRHPSVYVLNLNVLTFLPFIEAYANILGLIGHFFDFFTFIEGELRIKIRLHRVQILNHEKLRFYKDATSNSSWRQIEQFWGGCLEVRGEERNKKVLCVWDWFIAFAWRHSVGYLFLWSLLFLPYLWVHASELIGISFTQWKIG